MLTDVCSSKFVEPAKPAVYEFQSDTVLRAQPKQQHRPSPIEDYEPGRCSLAVSNGVEVRFSPLQGSTEFACGQQATVNAENQKL